MACQAILPPGRRMRGMDHDRTQSTRTRGTALACAGAIVADGSFVLWLLGGPILFLLSAAIGCVLVATGLVARYRTRDSV